MGSIPRAFTDNPWKNVPEEQRRRYLEYCKSCAKKDFCEKDCEELRAFYNEILNAADKRPFCVVLNKDPCPTVRHIIQITKKENEVPENFKKWYYGTYSEIKGDRFIFVFGEHRAVRIAKAATEKDAAVQYCVIRFGTSTSLFPDLGFEASDLAANCHKLNHKNLKFLAAELNVKDRSKKTDAELVEECRKVLSEPDCGTTDITRVVSAVHPCYGPERNWLWTVDEFIAKYQKQKGK